MSSITLVLHWNVAAIHKFACQYNAMIISSSQCKPDCCNTYHCCPDNVEFSKSWQTASPHYHIIMLQYYNVKISQNKILQYLPCCRDNVKFGKSWQLGLATWLRLCSFRLLQYQIHIYQIYSQQSFTFDVLSLNFLFFFFSESDSSLFLGYFAVWTFRHLRGYHAEILHFCNLQIALHLQILPFKM